MVMPSRSRNALDRGKIMERLDENKMFDELTPEVCEEIDEILDNTQDEQSDSEDDETQRHSVLILDDVQAALRNKDVDKWLRHLLATYRHRNCSVWICLQSYVALSKPCRDLLKHLIIFPVHSKKELQRIWEEWCGMMTFSEFRELLKHCHARKYSFANIDRQCQIYCRNFNPLRLTPAED